MQKQDGVTMLVFALHALYFKCFFSELCTKHSKLDEPEKIAVTAVYSKTY